MSVLGIRPTFRFRDFELDVGAYQLRRRGRPVPLERRAMDLLILLLEHPLELVTRSDIVDRLWGKDVFVDVTTGVNTVVHKTGLALHDSRDAPAFIETVPGKGYRFIAAVETSRPAKIEPRSRTIVAVLPFEILDADPEREYLAGGLTEETIAVLGQIDPEHLGVIGRTSILAYRRTTKTLAGIGRELGADYLVEGSIRTESSRLRITCRLVRASEQVQAWSASYEREPASILELQRELSGAIAEQIRIRLSPSRLEALEARHTRNPDACDLYLRGRSFWNLRTAATTRRANEYYERAVKLDPDYALAWSGLAAAYAASPMTGDANPKTAGPLAREAAAHAIRAQPSLAEAQTALGMVEFFLDWDWTAAEAALRRAIELDPSYAFGYLQLGHMLSQSARHAEAQAAARRACELDPLLTVNHAISSQVAFQARDYPAAIELAREAIVIDPEFWIGYVQRGQAYEQLGRTDLALALATAARFSESNSKALSLRGYVLARRGQIGEAREVLAFMESLARARYVPPYALVLVHAGLGEPDEAFARLDQAHADGDEHLIFLTVDPKWDSYRTGRRFEGLLARCGFARPT